jgi:curli biogenesis system outer membrane secretion channel CsgG
MAEKRKPSMDRSQWMRLQFRPFGLIFGLALLATLGCAAPQQSLVDSLPTYHGIRKIFVVLEFQNATDYGNDRLSRVASDMLITAMKGSGRFLLVERERLDRVLEEQALGQTGALDPNTRARVGQVLGAQFIVRGTVTEFGFKEQKEGTGTDGALESAAANSAAEIRCRKMDTRAVIDVRAVEVKSGRILWSEKAEGGDTGLRVCFRFGTDQGGSGVLYDERVATRTLQRAIDRCVYDISMAMKEEPWEGKIARIVAGKVFVVGGRDVGVPVNAEVEVCRVEAGPADPISGEILEMAEQVMGRGTIVRVEEHYAVVQIREGGGFSFNDLVRLANR